MSNKDDTIYLRHILDAIAQIEEYLTGVDEAGLFGNWLAQDGVIRQMEIIGEATRNLSPSLRRRYANAAWQDIAGIRSKLIHDYFGVSLKAVWLTAQGVGVHARQRRFALGERAPLSCRCHATAMRGLAAPYFSPSNRAHPWALSSSPLSSGPCFPFT